EDTLRRLQPTASLFRMARAMFTDAWGHRAAQQQAMRQTLRDQIKAIDNEVDKLVSRIVEASNAKVIAAYETRIATLEAEKVRAEEWLANSGQPQRTFEEMFEHAMTFLANPWKIWRNGGLEMKRTVLRLAFAKRPHYGRAEGLRTPEIAMPFKALAEICGGQTGMAHPRGFEPLASAFGGQRSISR
ncbi:MAG: recombinase, partial [Pseudomonadota bacterium]